MLAELDETWLSRRYYGGDLPAEAERCLHLAAAHFADAAPGHRLLDLTDRMGRVGEDDE
jgi:hypothetical protein